MKITLVLTGILAVCARAQTLTASQNPIPAGTVLGITLTNTTGGSVSYSTGETILLHMDGERTLPRFPAVTDTVALLPTGSSLPTQMMTLPSTGPGSSGSFVLYNRIGNGSCLRLDVGAPTSGFPAVHAYPRRIYSPIPSDTFASAGGTDEWMFVNTSGTSHVFGAGATVQLIGVASGVNLATVSLTGLSVPPQGRLVITLPTAGLPGIPMIVQSTWLDPVAGPLVRRHGVHDFAAGGASVHFTGGRTVPLTGTHEAWCVFRNLMPVPFTPPIPHVYAFAVGTVPGTTGLPGGVVAPLSIADPLVVASLTNGVSGALVNNGGPAVAGPIQGNAPVIGLLRADNILLQHPGPFLSGAVVRVAAVATAPGTGAWCASQMTEVVLQ